MKTTNIGKGAICLALLVAAAIPAAAQSALENEIRRHQAEVERALRDSKARLEAARRRLDAANLPAARSATGQQARQMVDAQRKQNQAPKNRPKYTFNGGRPFAYEFLLALQSDRQTRYIAGSAAFEPVEDTGGSQRLLARDNIQEVFSPDVLRDLPPGELTAMLRRTMHVGNSGREPDIDENLPCMLGNIEDWFFPPIPRTDTEERAEGEPVVRTTHGNWSDFGFYNSLDRSAQGYYDWSIKPTGIRSGILTVTDKRVFRAGDGSSELVGNGSFTFDMKSGILVRRNFRSAYTERGERTNITLDISPGATSRLPR